MILEFISKGTGPGGKDEVIQVSTDTPMPSNAQLNGNVTQNITATSSQATFEKYQAFVNETGATAGDFLLKVTSVELDANGGYRVHWYNETTGLLLNAAPTTPLLIEGDYMGQRVTVVQQPTTYNLKPQLYRAIAADLPRYDVNDIILHVPVFDAGAPNGYGHAIQPNPSQAEANTYNITNSTQLGQACSLLELVTNFEEYPAAGNGGSSGASQIYNQSALYSAINDNAPYYLTGEELVQVVSLQQSGATTTKQTVWYNKTNGVIISIVPPDTDLALFNPDEPTQTFKVKVLDTTAVDIATQIETKIFKVVTAHGVSTPWNVGDFVMMKIYNFAGNSESVIIWQKCNSAGAPVGIGYGGANPVDSPELSKLEFFA